MVHCVKQLNMVKIERTILIQLFTDKVVILLGVVYWIN